jgi:hypothetical protein
MGLCCNIALFVADKRNGSVLSKVIKGEALTDLITSPPSDKRREIAHNESMSDNVKDYLLNKDQRNALKRSIAKQTK